MGTTGWIVTAAVVAAVVIAATSVGVGGLRRRQLRELFGPEYDRVIEVDLRAGAAAAPPDPMSGRSDQPLLGPERAGHYRARWDRVQAGFVDRPALALHEADTLVSAVLAELGYPVDRLDRPGDPPAGPPGDGRSSPVERYRAMQRVNLRADASETTTDELRAAFVQYRVLLDDLLGADAQLAVGDR